jgi:hypothetical protein
MNKFSGKLRLFSLVICFAVIAVVSIPQATSAAVPSVAKLSGIKEIVASPGFWGGSSFAVGTDGSVWTWGSNVFGQFANGTAGPEGWTITPHRVAALDHTKQLVIGSGYYLALKEDGTVTGWGDYLNKSATVAGNWVSGKQHELPVPQTIAGLTDVVSISSGLYSTLALRKDGSLLQWKTPEFTNDGYNELPSVTEVQGLTGVKWTSSSDVHAAIKDNGTLWVWSTKMPTPIKDVYHVKSASLDGSSLLALTESGNVWATVSSSGGGPTGITMKKMGGLSGIVSVQTKNGFNLVSNKKGEYWVWKANTDQPKPQRITVINSIAKLTLDLGGFVAIKKDGTVWTWGTQNVSENNWSFTQPKQIKGLQNPVSFAKGENSKYALLKDGTAVAWGTNMFGQLGISALDSRPFTISPILKPVSLIVNGKKIDSVQSAIYLEDSVRVPLRDVAEALGYTLSWDGDIKLSKAGKEIRYSERAFVLGDGTSINVQPEAIKVSYTSLVPAVALAKALGASLEWNSTLYQLTLQTQPL